MSIEHPAHILTGVLVGYLTSIIIGLLRKRRGVISVKQRSNGDVEVGEGGIYTPTMAKVLADVILAHANAKAPYNAGQ